MPDSSKIFSTLGREHTSTSREPSSSVLLTATSTPSAVESMKVVPARSMTWFLRPAASESTSIHFRRGAVDRSSSPSTDTTLVASSTSLWMIPKFGVLACTFKPLLTRCEDPRPYGAQGSGELSLSAPIHHHSRQPCPRAAARSAMIQQMSSSGAGICPMAPRRRRRSAYADRANTDQREQGGLQLRGAQGRR